jgi:hypothetical protein
MRRFCPSCHASSIHVDFTFDADYLLKFDKQMENDTEIPMKCTTCGYSWTAVLESNKRK